MIATTVLFLPITSQELQTENNASGKILNLRLKANQLLPTALVLESTRLHRTMQRRKRGSKVSLISAFNTPDYICNAST